MTLFLCSDPNVEKFIICAINMFSVLRILFSRYLNSIFYGGWYPNQIIPNLYWLLRLLKLVDNADSSSTICVVFYIPRFIIARIYISSSY